MQIEYLSNELYHHGVLGMKWGKRKDRKSGSTHVLRNTVKKAKNVAQNKKSVKKLSDSELQAKINRLQMEKRYRDLRKDEVSAGRQLVGEIIRSSSKSLGTQLVFNIAGEGINKAAGVPLVNTTANKSKKKND